MWKCTLDCYNTDCVIIDATKDCLSWWQNLHQDDFVFSVTVQQCQWIINLVQQWHDEMVQYNMILRKAWKIQGIDSELTKEFPYLCIMCELWCIGLMIMSVMENSWHCNMNKVYLRKHRHQVRCRYNMVHLIMMLNNDDSRLYIRLWTHKRHPIPHPHGWDMGCPLCGFQRKSIVSHYSLHLLCFVV